MPIHIAITRRVRAGCEAEFQSALREFFQASFGHPGVLGAHLLVPPPGSDSREYGILRTFTDEKERDAFYDSDIFRTWDERARMLTEGEPACRQLHGLEAYLHQLGVDMLVLRPKSQHWILRRQSGRLENDLFPACE